MGVRNSGDPSVRVYGDRLRGPTQKQCGRGPFQKLLVHYVLALHGVAVVGTGRGSRKRTGNGTSPLGTFRYDAGHVCDLSLYVPHGMQEDPTFQ